ncbi:MAG TPA: GNAT family N-acetyltransferase [Actinomycetota bacterium]|nr:GNAT family N-acetyltransferase [Actinomycetota bacterium]
MSRPYPGHREADVVLRDGSTIRVRPVRPGDEEALARFLEGLSEQSRWLRFFGSVDVARAAAWAAGVDYDRRYGLVATTGDDGAIAGHVAYQRADETDRAEVALAIADSMQGRGLGTILLAHLAQAAEGAGVSVFVADVLPQNHRMIEVFRESGFPVAMRTEPGVIHVELPTSLSPAALERFEGRERTAAVAAMRTFLAPRSVAVVGASRTRGTIGGEVFHNLVATGFEGPVYPVNPKAEVVQSVVAYPSVRDCPGPVDVAVVVVPAPAVVDVARDCAAKGVRGLVVISAGFAETGDAGRARQRELMSVCRAAGMRVIGPNCMGIVNTSPGVRLDATFAPVFPPHGRVGFSSQSGALGLAIIDYAHQLGLGISSFASVGNKADVSGNDLLQYWEADDDTDLILLYLESFGNPRKFARIARRVGKTKPVVAVKSGRSAAGARATSSHTGALLAASDVTVDALFAQAGVIRTDTLQELFDVASLLANQPPPTGRRVAIVTNAGGPGILCADACEAGGLEVAPLADDVRVRLHEFLPPEASTVNPVDMIASASGDDYRRAIDAVAASDDVDAVIVIFIPPLVTRAEDVARSIRDAARGLTRRVPVLSVFMSARGVPAELRDDDVRIPSYAFPEEAAGALARAVRYGTWRLEPEAEVPSFDGVRCDEAASVIAHALRDGPRWLTPEEVARLLSCYGIPFARWTTATTPEDAGRAADDLGAPVALKAVAPGLVHKTEAGAVRLSLRGADDVTAEARAMAARVRDAGHEVESFVVQEMVEQGVEMLVGVVHDQSFGPVVACGAGGVAVELLKDVQVRIAPLTARDAREMVRGLATYPLLEGYRGAPRVDAAAVENVLLRVGALVEDHPEVAEMDCNPVMVLPDAAVVVDARVRVEAAAPGPPLSARTPP